MTRARRTLRAGIVAAALIAAGSVDASPRDPVFVEGGAVAAVHPGLSGAWGGVPFHADFKLGGGYWIGQRVAVFGAVGVTPELQYDDVGAGDYQGSVTERLRFLNFRAGAKINLWPQQTFVHVNAVGAASYAFGAFEFVLGDDVVAKQTVSSIGVGAGLELNLIKFKRQGISVSAMYYLQPAALAEDMGFRTSGTTDLGGIEIGFGYLVFL